MIRNIMLSLLILFVATSVVHAEEKSFNERKANLAEISSLRVGYASGVVRIVLDMSKNLDFTEKFVENPSRIIIDLDNAWLSPNVKREMELKSSTAKKLRIAQFNPTTVRLVIESDAGVKISHLSGGPKGHRLVIDVSGTIPIVKPVDTEQKERELKEQKERELKEQKERELKEQKERELREQKERELREQKERELKEREKHLKEVERQQKEREKQLKEQEKKLKEQQEREAKEQEKKLKEQKEREAKEQREREKKERREREKEKKKSDKAKTEDDDNQPEVNEPFKELDKDLNTITALSGKKIVIDPGHGGNDAGAIGPTGVMEKNVTLNVALELKRLLEAEGAQVIMTRETDRTVSSKGAAASDIEELGARCDVANRIGADIFISIHADSFTRPEARGTTGYYYSKSTTGRGQKLADCIRRNLIEQLGTPSRGTQPCNFYVVKHTDMPATLIELGFISNKEEEKLLDSAEGVRKAAQGILDGIEDYFG